MWTRDNLIHTATYISCDYVLPETFTMPMSYARRDETRRLKYVKRRSRNISEEVG